MTIYLFILGLFINTYAEDNRYKEILDMYDTFYANQSKQCPQVAQTIMNNAASVLEKYKASENILSAVEEEFPAKILIFSQSRGITKITRKHFYTLCEEEKKRIAKERQEKAINEFFSHGFTKDFFENYLPKGQ